jgi:hypothetical protein
VQHSHAEFIHVEVVASLEIGLKLTFRSSMNVDYYRTLSAKLRRRAIEKARKWEAIEALPSNKFGLDKTVSIYSPLLAVCPAFDGKGFGIERVSIGWGADRIHTEPEIPSILVPAKGAEDIANRKINQMDVTAGARIDQVEDRKPILVCDQADQLSIWNSELRSVVT